MNQILSTSMPVNEKKVKNRNSKPIEIGTILRVFAIVLLIFGTFLIGIGIYSIIGKQGQSQSENLQPSISIEDKSEDTILLKVVHSKNISKLEYRWNDEESTVVNGSNGKYIEKEIKVPSGTNTLHVLVVDVDGNEIPYEKQYERQSNINFEVSGNKIKITYEGENKVSYMTYRWDEEDEKTININDTKINQEIEAIKGLHTLTVIVVDEDNNTDTKIQKINGVSKPKVTVALSEDEQHFVIKASDDEKLSTVEFKLNQDDDQDYILNLDDRDMKELNYALPMELQAGQNFIEVIVKNSNGITEETGLVRFDK